jgi:hypothetical protein
MEGLAAERRERRFQLPEAQRRGTVLTYRGTVKVISVEYWLWVAYASYAVAAKK